MLEVTAVIVTYSDWIFGVISHMGIVQEMTKQSMEQKEVAISVNVSKFSTVLILQRWRLLCKHCF